MSYMWIYHMMSQKSSGQEFSKPQFYHCSYASKTRSQGACCQAQKKQGLLEMQLLSASKWNACVTWRWLLTNSPLPLTQRSSNFVGLGTTVNKNHSARISACSHLAWINLNVLIPWWNKQHWRGLKGDTRSRCCKRWALFWQVSNNTSNLLWKKWESGTE